MQGCAGAHNLGALLHLSATAVFFPPQFFWRARRGFIQFTPLIAVISVRLPLTPPSPFPFFPLHTLNHQHSTAVPLTNVPHALGSHPHCEELHFFFFFFDLWAGSPGAWCHTSPGISENTRETKQTNKKKTAVESSLPDKGMFICDTDQYCSLSLCVTTTPAVQCRPRDHGVVAAA